MNCSTGTTQCRFCSASVSRTFIDLGMHPLCESFLPAEALNRMEPFYPLHAKVCEECFLVQIEAYVSPEEIFTEYAYFSSYSDSWVEHARRYAEAMIERFGLGESDHVVELASNDGYLLQHFVHRGVPALGVEPAANVAAAAIDRGVATRVAFFGRSEAEAMVAEGLGADLIAANNVLAQVPDLNDFVAGIATLLKPEGTFTAEFPHLMKLIDERQYDTIYHEHFSYFSLVTARRVLAAHGLSVFDVEELPTHGGSLRLFAGHADRSPASSERAEDVARRERAAGYDSVDAYIAFRPVVEATKREFLRLLIDARAQGAHIAAYGAPGKGNTLLNYCGIRTDLIDYAVDRNPYKHGRFTPGTHIPIHPTEHLAETRPDFIVILPWNLREEILAQLEYARQWGAKFIIPIPRVEVIG